GLAGPQVRFDLFPIRDVHGHAEDMRHMVEMDEFARDQHVEPFARAVSKSPFLLVDEAGLAQAGPEVLAILLVLPQPKLVRSSPQDFVAGVTRPIDKGIIDQHVLAVTRPRDRNNDRTVLEGSAKARFAGAKLGRAFVNATFEELVELQHFALG